jgi:hypothetical protein
MLHRIGYFKAYFGKIGAKVKIFFELLTLNLVISTNFWAKFGLNLAFFFFLFFKDLAFLKLLKIKFGLFHFLDLATLAKNV